MKSREIAKCGGFEGVLKALTYMLIVILAIDASIVVLLRLVMLFRDILGDGFTIAIAIIIITAVTYCTYFALRKALKM
jgi:hypothetical protein